MHGLNGMHDSGRTASAIEGGGNFIADMPIFPTPAITIFPLRSMASRRAWMAVLKVSSSCWLIAVMPFCSMVNVFFA